MALAPVHARPAVQFAPPVTLKPFEAQLASQGIRVYGAFALGKQGTTYMATQRGREIVLKEAPLRIAQNEVEALNAIAPLSKGRTPRVSFTAHDGQSMIYAMNRGGAAMTEQCLAACAKDHTLGIDIGLNLLKALEATHAAGYWHGDLSRNNFLLEGQDPNSLMLIDFGLSVKLGQPLTYRKPARVFMHAPEAKDLKPVAKMPIARPRQDLFAAAVHIATMLSGKTPYSPPEALKENAAAWLEAYAAGPRLSPTIAPRVQAVLRRGLAFRSTERYQTAAELIAELTEARRSITSPRLAVG